MVTGKTLLAFTAGIVVAIAGLLHFFGPDAMRALGRILHGGQ